MPEGYIDNTWKRPVEVAGVPVEIGDAARRAGGAPASADGEASSLRRYGNDALNSRLLRRLPEGRWEILWKADLAYDLSPELVLHHTDRIVVQGAKEWMLFSDGGDPLATGRFGHSDVVLDVLHDLIYAMDRSGYLAAWAFSDGHLVFRMPVPFGDHFYRTDIVRRNNDMLLVGIERAIQPHSLPPERSRLEVLNLGDPLRIDEELMLRSVTTRRALDRYSLVLHSAVNDDTVFAAVGDSLYIASLDLELRRVLTARFAPLALSVDEVGNMYLVVRVRGNDESERVALWIVTSEGERIAEAELEDVEPEEDAVHPAIIGYDHRAYLLLEDRILAFEPDGKPAWSHRSGNPIVGAAITADDRLLMATEGLIASFDSEGELTAHFYLEGASFTSPPALTAAGRLLVTTEEHLYCLQAVE